MTIEERIIRLERELAELKENKKVETMLKQETRFKPKKGEEYYYVDNDGDIVSTINEGGNIDLDTIYFYNTFRDASEENLKKYAHDVLRVQNRLMQLHEELCPEYWPDWKPLKTNCHIWYHHGINKWVVSGSDYTECHDVNFTKEAAKKACEILNAEKFMMGGTGDEAD